MKKALIITCTLILSLSFLYAQKTETMKVSGSDYPDFLAKNEYKYPVYTKAQIAFKNGVMASARINYNNFKQSMKYIGEKGDTLEIANPEDINYIAIGADSLFYHEGAYYQWVASSATARLVAIHKFKEGPRALVGAFGIASPAKHVESRDAMLNDNGVSTRQLGKNEEVTIIKETTYYISPLKDNTRFVAANKKNLDRLFPKKNVEDFIKENKINLNKEEHLIDLMVHLSKK